MFKLVAGRRLKWSGAVLFLVAFIFMQPGEAARRSRRKAPVNHGLGNLNAKSLKQKRQSIQGKKKQLERQKKDAKLRANQVMQQIEDLDTRLGLTQGKLRQLGFELTKLRTHTTFLVRERERKVAEYKTKREQFKRRLVRFYKSGSTSTIGLLLEAKDYSDLQTRGEYVRAIVRYDQAMLKRVKTLYEEIQEKILEVDEQMARTKQVEQEIQRQEAALKQEQGQKKGVLNKLRMDIEAYDRAIQDLVAISNAIAAEIARQSTVLSRGLTRDGFMSPVVCRITSGFGYRRHPILGRAKMHTGVDLGCSCGTPIRAASSGRIYWAAWKRGYGNTVILVHAAGVSTLYAHMSSTSVSSGQLVKRGQVVGHVGSTGLSTGCHLHYEVHRNGKVIDPMSYLR